MCGKEGVLSSSMYGCRIESAPGTIGGLNVMCICRALADKKGCKVEHRRSHGMLEPN
jgi:hypothetical protein